MNSGLPVSQSQARIGKENELLLVPGEKPSVTCWWSVLMSVIFWTLHPCHVTERKEGKETAESWEREFDAAVNLSFSFRTAAILLFFFLMATAFMGYVLPFGQMSFWGATVITNLLSPFPSLIEWVCGGHYVYYPTLKRFFLFHFIFPFLLCGFLFLHLFYLHFLSSNNPLRNSTENMKLIVVHFLDWWTIG